MRALLLAVLLAALPAAALVPDLPVPVAPAGSCALVDLRIGESNIVGAQCTSARFVSAAHHCDLLDAGMTCHVVWEADAIAEHWLLPGSVAARVDGSCASSVDNAWGPGEAVLSVATPVTCATQEFFVTRGTCVLVPLTIHADFDGLLSGPDQELSYSTGVCDNRDPL
jgi:hypothetical protein